MSVYLHGLRVQRGALSTFSVALAVAVVALIWIELYATATYGPIGKQVPLRSVSAAGMDGWLDEPYSESIVGTKLTMRGWALAPDGIARVEIRLDGRVYQARYGVQRDDVSAARPGYPDNPFGGFTFDGDFADLSPM
ncbi:MAG TPA: hypothetical protein VFQ55_19535, partial [Casimicrobiaceae bacterium]|nr:hypothetical protein [Casimicrobiaceae bacterium]